jgi:Derlin-2/3
MLSPMIGMPFLGSPLTSTLVYVWSRRNPDTRLSLMGILVFSAPYLPYVLMGFSFLLHGTVPKDEIVGAGVGHVYYFLSDVYPTMGGERYRPMEPPEWWTRLFEGRRIRLEDTAPEPVNTDIAAAAAPEVGQVL